MTRIVVIVVAMTVATPTMASDASYCRDWARDTLAIGRILVDDLAHANDGVLRTKSQALYQVCISEGLAPSDGINYEVDTSPKTKPPPKKAVAVKAKPKEEWVKQCEKFMSWDPKTGTVVTLKSDPERVPCPYK